ncbi:hypothetical protein NX722_10505 [Endozoicomonas gorgoniicola]|uniref:Endonuclease/exonuclease/phosphatase domain-containing protein n=1 Tax=Endozoicomonas gorgoniicola TaxID=1234144 RepID=A0ABT3MUK5_9GAMM|nr:hypothetical protein [Endozoicomonas gorgoniicola]MCW7553060.1 hypothetical protein [Endozoicomonas gorgoniicola]
MNNITTAGLILFSLCWFSLPLSANNIYPWLAKTVTLHNDKTRNNNYELNPRLPEGCSSGPCPKRSLMRAYQELQFKGLKRNQAIPTHDKDGKTLRVVTYNVHFWQQAGNEHFSTSENVANELIKEMVAMNADVYLLQEVAFEQNIIHRLLKALNMSDNQYYFCPESGNFKNALPVGNLTLIRKKAKYLYTSYYFYNPTVTGTDFLPHDGILTDTPSLQGRCAIINTIIPDGTDQALQIVNIHLDHTDDSQHKTLQLEGTLKKIAADPYYPQIGTLLIGGDLNTPMARQLPERKRLAITRDARSRNTTVDLHLLELLEQHGYTDSFDHACIAPPGATVWSLIRIDYLFLKPQNHNNACFTGQYLFHTLNSDHSALVFDIKFTP